jgi:hypothetical protein
VSSSHAVVKKSLHRPMCSITHTVKYCLQLLCSVPASGLRLTKIDTEIYSAFRSQFHDLDIGKLDVAQIKSPEGKEVRDISMNVYVDLSSPAFMVVSVIVISHLWVNSSIVYYNIRP